MPEWTLFWLGDSVGTTLLGHKTTIPVDMTDMVRHTAAVRRSQPNCFWLRISFWRGKFSFRPPSQSARRLMQEGGADAVKIEGGRDVADDIEKFVATGIPVLGHIGLLPQTVKAIGGYRKFGSDRDEAEDLYTDAIALEEAGCFAVIAEMMDERMWRKNCSANPSPLIGIGSGAGCDGQILVTTDLLGYNLGKPPSFVKTYANLNQVISKALSQYVSEVKAGSFPNNSMNFCILGAGAWGNCDGGLSWPTVVMSSPCVRGEWSMPFNYLLRELIKIIYRELLFLQTCKLARR